MDHMPSLTHSTHAVAEHPSLSLADVLARVEADPALTPRSRADMLSALRTLRRVLGLSLAAVPADPALLRRHLADACPARVGVSAHRWHNIRSLTLKALGRAGVPTLPGRSGDALTGAWEQLSCLLPDPGTRYRLSRFMRHCSARSIEPAQVDAAAFAGFRQALRAMSLNAKPDALHRAACLAWNGATERTPGWPGQAVPVPSFSRRYALDWDSFPAAFGTDCRAFLDHGANQDPFADDYAPSVKLSTVAMRRKQILQLASVLVLAGTPVQGITGLACLVAPDNARLALRFLRDRAGGRESKYLHQQALLLKTVARHWVKAPARDVDLLRQFAARLAPRQVGMVERNRAKLRQFDDPGNVGRLLGLPARVFDELALRDRGLRQDALRAMFALAVELLIVAPMRVSNLVGLQLGRHLVTSPGRHGGIVHLRIPPAETKTGEPFEALLRARTVGLLTTFTGRYRGRLTAVPSSTLFASPGGGTRDAVTFGQALGAFVRRETGLLVNPHLFRHLAVKLLLDENPGDIETARRILGHRSSATTERAYADRSAAAAHRRYDDMIDRRRSTSSEGRA